MQAHADSTAAELEQERQAHAQARQGYEDEVDSLMQTNQLLTAELKSAHAHTQPAVKVD